LRLLAGGTLGTGAGIPAKRPIGVLDAMLLTVALDGLDPRLPTPALIWIAGPLPHLLLM